MNIHSRLVLTHARLDDALCEVYRASVYEPEAMLRAVIALERAIRAHERTLIEHESLAHEAVTP